MVPTEESPEVLEFLDDAVDDVGEDEENNDDDRGEDKGSKVGVEDDNDEYEVGYRF